MDAAPDFNTDTGSRLQRANAAAVQWLEDRQHPEGYWAGILESNVCIEAEWILAFHVLGNLDDPKIPALRQGILDEQRTDGAWEVYYRAPRGDINATVEAYAALRTVGLPPEAPALRRARQWILANGGLGRVRVFTRYWLALIGEWPWSKTPNIPPEIIFLPRRFPFNIYNFSCWARATILPLAVLSAHSRFRSLPPECRLNELFPGGRDVLDYELPVAGSGLWERFFRKADRWLHRYQHLGSHPLRRLAIKACLEWIIRHQDADGSWGGIQPPWIYSLMALHACGYPRTHPCLHRGLAALDSHWSYHKGRGLHIQACESPVWDTLLALQALLDCGPDYLPSQAVDRALDWILDHEIRVPGDWRHTIGDCEPGGWAFEHANDHYPDIDDTAVALTVLGRLRDTHPDPQKLQPAISRGFRWLTAMQCRNGGWASFDRDNDRRILTLIPFCDFGEVLDPPSVDVTGHVLEAFGTLGLDLEHPAVRRAVAYVCAEQEREGCWFGRWGVNYIYGTCAVLCGLRAVGFDMRSMMIGTARRWILDHQNADGGWGESCESYMEPRARGRGPSTPSQTAWALMALLAAAEPTDRKAVEDGAAFLCASQQLGTWDEPWYTGTGFPGYLLGARIDLHDSGTARQLQQKSELSRGFMINYNLYRHYFPLSALGRVARNCLR
jgi:squalene-hopene/tetraprenyl-beta-curcumene cyclase